ncbi:LLM class flavin-dependent oxidoreductase [Antrihabitans sp. YC2-6]|uniref:LLM class flavin-dependent oxidoreductase n=1 Tax=Antrihabitans sp. YC2-6 TaxID=2799498 RepID=UPI0018F6D8EF|nr:LLM class flavin-dependent oxidoreductase [Antrihabitans sp. YC2-6]MBJ8343698.1 LLM class flavin-dependent oxidoreductase [Antrihabitans sp. YC2-6]
MTTRRLAVALTPMETRRDVIVETALLAERLGYEVFSLAEGWGYDSTLLLTEIAMRTERIKLLPGVLSVWSRSPATLAMGASTLHEISGGRSILGLGTSSRALTEGLHDLEFTGWTSKLREVTTAVRTMLDGGRAPIDDSRTARALKLGLSPKPDLPIWIAASGKTAIEATADLADGWYPLFLTRERLRKTAAEINARRGDRAPITVVAGPFAVADPDPVVARNIAASCLAWYICAMGDGYARLIAGQGFSAEVDAIRVANPRPSPTHSVVPPEARSALDALTAYGTPTELKAQLDGWSTDADILGIVLPAGIPWETIEATLTAAV